MALQRQWEDEDVRDCRSLHLEGFSALVQCGQRAANRATCTLHKKVEGLVELSRSEGCYAS